MNNDGYKFCNFRLYCPKCEHYEAPEDKDPCNECLTYPTNYESEKPVNYKERVKDNGKDETV